MTVPIYRIEIFKIHVIIDDLIILFLFPLSIDKKNHSCLFAEVHFRIWRHVVDDIGYLLTMTTSSTEEAAAIFVLEKTNDLWLATRISSPIFCTELMQGKNGFREFFHVWEIR